MEHKQSQAPIIAKLDDIDREFAERAFHGTSFSPEKRGESRRNEYAAAVNGLYAGLWPLAKTGEQKALLAAEMERYREGYLRRMTGYLASHSNVISPMITGPARFPTVRNQKRSQWADNKANDLCEWEAKAREAIGRKLMDARPGEDKADEEWKRVQLDIADSLGTIKAIDDGTNRYTARTLIVSNLAGRLERLAYNGEAELVKKALGMVREFNAFEKKPVVTDRHKLWTFAEIAETIAAKREQTASSEPATIAEAEGVRVVANFAEERVQILFVEKPSREVIAKLKGEAWKWSPNAGAWQRKLTEAAKHSAKRVTGLL